MKNGNSVAVEAKPNADQAGLETARRLSIELVKALDDLDRNPEDRQRFEEYQKLESLSYELAQRLGKLVKGELYKPMIEAEPDDEPAGNSGLIELIPTTEFSSQQGIAAGAYYQAAKLVAAVERLTGCDEARERAGTHFEDLERDAGQVCDRLLLIAGAMTDDDGRTAFEVAAAGAEGSA
jgi:hypothetical protein